MPAPCEIPTGDDPHAVGESLKSKWLLTEADANLVMERQLAALMVGR